MPHPFFLKVMFKLCANRSLFMDLVQITKFRMMAEDGIPMSQAKNEPVVGMHWTMKFDHRTKTLEAIHACLPKLRASSKSSAQGHIMASSSHTVVSGSKTRMARICSTCVSLKASTALMADLIMRLQKSIF